MISFIENIFENIHNGNVTASIFIDLKKTTFDTEDHSILFETINDIGITVYIYIYI